MGNPGAMRKLRAFWQRTSDGLNAEQLWAQFRRETRSSLNLYSAETGRNLQEEWSVRKGRRRVVTAVAGAMYDRLTPVRRVLLLVALVLLVIFGVDNPAGSGVHISFNSTPSAIILLVLLLLELADRVGLKRDLAFAVEVELGRAEQLGPVDAGDRGARAIRVANDLDQLTRRLAATEALAAGAGLHTGGSWLADDKERDIIVRAGRRRPVLVHDHTGDGPHPERGPAVPVPRHENKLARNLPAHAMGCGHDQVTCRAVHHACGAEVSAQRLAGGGSGEQCPYGGRPVAGEA